MKWFQNLWGHKSGWGNMGDSWRDPFGIRGEAPMLVEEDEEVVNNSLSTGAKIGIMAIGFFRALSYLTLVIPLVEVIVFHVVKYVNTNSTDNIGSITRSDSNKDNLTHIWNYVSELCK